MEADTTLVWANGIIELNTVTQVSLHFAAVVHPCHTERKDTVGLHKALDDFSFFKLRVLVIDVFNRQQHFLHSLKVLTFSRMLGLKRSHNTLNIHNITLKKV